MHSNIGNLYIKQICPAYYQQAILCSATKHPQNIPVKTKEDNLEHYL